MTSNRYDRPTAESVLDDALPASDQPTAEVLLVGVQSAQTDRGADSTAPVRGAASIDADLPALGTVIVNKYVLERLLGQGGMGAVYAGKHLITGKRVAVKWLRGDPERQRDAAARLAREARAAGRVNHPNVVDIYDAGFAGRHPFMVMELLEGEPLDVRIARAPLSVTELVDLMLPVLRGVAAAHASGIVHRDLKPGNIFLCLDPESGLITPKVLDFGISKLSVGVEEDLTVTSTGMQVGTPAFMAPEQVRGEPVDARSDVYALAVTLYLTVTGRFPFEGRVRHELFTRVLTQRALPPSTHRKGLSPRLDALIMRGLERDPRRRFATVQELADALALHALKPRWWRWPFERHHELFSRRLVASLLVLGVLTGLWLFIGSLQTREQRAVRARATAAMATATPRPVAEPSGDPLQSVAPERVTPAPLPPAESPGEPARPPVVRRTKRRVARPVQRAAVAPALPPRTEPDRFMSW